MRFEQEVTYENGIIVGSWKMVLSRDDMCIECYCPDGVIEFAPDGRKTFHGNIEEVKLFKLEASDDPSDQES